jgi:hypothetical protein
MTIKFISTKKLSAKPELLARRFNSLKKLILEKKKVSKSTGDITMRLNGAEFESIVDSFSTKVWQMR